MYRSSLLIFALCSSLFIWASSKGEQHKESNNIPTLERRAPKRVCSGNESCNDFIYVSKTNDKYIWSIRDRKWVSTPSSSLFWGNFGLINGPLVLRAGVTQEYVVAGVSQYKGTPKYVWRIEPSPFSPSKVGEIYTDDEVEVEWEIRTSPGVRMIDQPQFPSKLRYWEPVIASFKIEVIDSSVQRLEIYVNGYRDGKVVCSTWIPLVINRDGYSEIEAQREKKDMQDRKRDFVPRTHMDWRFAPWSEKKGKIFKKEYEDRHALTKRYHVGGLKPGEFLTDTDDSSKR